MVVRTMWAVDVVIRKRRAALTELISEINVPRVLELSSVSSQHQDHHQQVHLSCLHRKADLTPMPPQPDLLSPAAYDEDASSLRSPSEQDSDSEDDQYLSKSRTTVELAQHDRAVLEDEEELEKLLTRSSPARGLRRIFSPNASSVRIGKRNRRDEKRADKRNRRYDPAGEDGELMYEMEEGYRDDSPLMRPSEGDWEKAEYNYDQVGGLSPYVDLAKLSAETDSVGKDYSGLCYDVRVFPYPFARRIQGIEWFSGGAPP